MKKMMMIAALFISASIQMANATEKEDVKISKEAKRAFEQQFPGAYHPSWQQLAGMDVYMVRFGYKSKSLLTYIDGEGAILGTVRNLKMDDLPFSVSQRIEKTYEKYAVQLIEELTIESETSYLLLLENDKAKITVRVFGNGEYQQLKKLKKKVQRA